MVIKKSGWPNIYSCSFLEDGTVSYDDGIFYVANETIRKMAPTMIGKPVVIQHQHVDADNYEELRKNAVIVGNVTKVYFNSEDGWWWCDFIVDTAKGRERIDRYNDKVSCAYTVTGTKEGGSWHDQPYKAEITDGEFTHLALVENPRYEKSIIKPLPEMMLVNGKVAYHTINKQQEDNAMDFKTIIENLWNKKPDGTKEKADPVLVLNGKEFPLKDVLNALSEKLNAEGEMKGIHAKEEELVDINGHSYKINELKAALKNWKPGEKENEKCTCGAEEGKEHRENCPCFHKKNSSDEEKAKEEKEKLEKENTRIFEKARANGKSIAQVILDEAAERNNSRNNESPEVKELRLENERLKKEKEAEELFNSLNTLSNFVGDGSDAPAEAAAPLTREERANKKKAQLDKQFAK